MEQKEHRSGHRTAWRSTAAVARNALRMDSRHFRRVLPRQQGIELFREHVGLIEVETTSYCNRTCSFCPNAFIDRRQEMNVMPEACWEKILADLQALNYGGSFFWSRYSEPTAEDRLVERVREVRKAAPLARIGANTNGDYLNADLLQRLIDAGMNRLFVDIYLPDDTTFDQDKAKKYTDRFLKRIDKTATVKPGYGHNTVVNVSGIHMVTVAKNSASMKALDMSNRGGLIQLARRTARTAPCYAPFKHFVVDWDGSVMICCQVRSDEVSHRDAIVAKIGENDVGLIEGYLALADWRKSLRGFGPKTGPCESCNVFEYDQNRAARLISKVFADEALPGVPLLKDAARRMLPRRFYK